MAMVDTRIQRYLICMRSTFRTSFGCTHCRKTVPVLLRDERLAASHTFSSAVEFAEEALRPTGWRFMSGEVEAPDGDLEYRVGLWCPTCSTAFDEYLASRSDR